MKKFLFGCLISTVLTTSGLAAESGLPSPVGQNPSDWSMWFDEGFDNFSSQPIKPDSGFWNLNYLGGYKTVTPTEKAGYIKDQVEVSQSGVLKLKISPTPIAEYVWSTGHINSFNKFGLADLNDGKAHYIETRIFAPMSDNTMYNRPSFWITNNKGTEFTVMQPAGKGLVQWQVKSPHLYKTKKIPMQEVGGWHVYAMQWQPGKDVSFFYDGKFVGAAQYTEKSKYWFVFDNEAAGNNKKAPSTMSVDYLRFWTHK